MADYGASDTSTTTLLANQFPISEVYVPNDALRALEGGPVSTDSGSKKSAPMSIYAKDGGDVAQGTTTDGAYSGSGAGTTIALLKKLVAELAATLTVAGTITEANSAAILADTADIETSVANIPPLGQALAAASVPVVLTAAQQTALTPPAAISGFALEAGHLATIDTHIPALGQALAAGSIPVVLTAIQQTALTPPAAITGFALEAGHLATIDTNIAAVLVDTADIETNTANIPPLGQALAAASVPVVLTAAQLTTLTPPAAITGFALEAGNLASILAALDDGQETMANSISVAIASDQSAVPASQNGTWTVQPGNTPNTSAWLVQPVAGTTGGSTPSHLLSLASNNATSLKASAGTLYGYSISNTNAAARWVKFYNKASSPSPASDTVVWAEQVPGNATLIAAFPEGMNFSTGIAFAAVVNASDTDNTSIGAGDLSIDIRYK